MRVERREASGEEKANRQGEFFPESDVYSHATTPIAALWDVPPSILSSSWLVARHFMPRPSLRSGTCHPSPLLFFRFPKSCRPSLVDTSRGGDAAKDNHLVGGPLGVDRRSSLEGIEALELDGPRGWFGGAGELKL